ncbi:MAG TPA: tetratricopeptide repeat protein [Phnomibacter sp.]|nr:tetratricopeptide repeat protein [Phnomibacter sp.]
MRKFFFWVPVLFFAVAANAQDAKQMHETGLKYLQQSDYGNAIIVLKKAAELEPNNTDILNDLGLSYFMAGQYKQGYDLMRPVAESKFADDRSFQITCMLLRGGNNIQQAELVYKIGLQSFPKSGPLYCDYGEFLELTQPGSGLSIAQWEKGIRTDPEFPGNYYQAARHYSNAGENFWSIVYGEIFVNMESFTTRTVETKNILYDAYKKLFAFGLAPQKEHTPFQKQVLAILAKQEPLTVNGITPEVLTAVRARFILDWYNGPEKQFPFKLFEHQHQLLQEGVFDAYNQWIFGSVANLSAFQNWTKTHPDEYVSYNQLQRNKMFKMPAGQYYH